MSSSGCCLGSCCALSEYSLLLCIVLTFCVLTMCESCGQLIRGPSPLISIPWWAVPWNYELGNTALSLSCFCQIFHHSHSDEKFTNTPFSLGSELSFPSVDIRLSPSTHPNFLTIPLAPVIIPLSLSPHSERLPTTHQNHDTEAKAQIYLS